jgi:hypothetical protein
MHKISLSKIDAFVKSSSAKGGIKRPKDEQGTVRTGALQMDLFRNDQKFPLGTPSSL